MAAITLRVKAEYRHGPRGLAYAADQVIEVDAALAAWLLADAPENFTPVVVETLDAPPVDKQVKRAPRKK